MLSLSSLTWLFAQICFRSPTFHPFMANSITNCSGNELTSPIQVLSVILGNDNGKAITQCTAGPFEDSVKSVVICMMSSIVFAGHIISFHMTCSHHLKTLLWRPSNLVLNLATLGFFLLKGRI